MGINPYHDWVANYQIIPGKEKVVSELQKLAKDADHVYLATDLDREGEAIAWHLREIIGGDEERYKRVVFNEITKNGIQQAFQTPGELNMDVDLAPFTAGSYILRIVDGEEIMTRILVKR